MWDTQSSNEITINLKRRLIIQNNETDTLRQTDRQTDRERNKHGTVERWERACSSTAEMSVQQRRHTPSMTYTHTSTHTHKHLLSTAVNLTTFTHVDGSRGLWFQRRLSVCLSVYPYDISKTDAARITKRDIEMFHDQVLETNLFWS